MPKLKIEIQLRKIPSKVIFYSLEGNKYLKLAGISAYDYKNGCLAILLSDMTCVVKLHTVEVADLYAGDIFYSQGNYYYHCEVKDNRQISYDVITLNQVIFYNPDIVLVPERET